jgi:hypothetical protein
MLEGLYWKVPATTQFPSAEMSTAVTQGCPVLLVHREA